MMDLIFIYNYWSFFNLLNYLKQMLISYANFYSLAISLNVDDFEVHPKTKGFNNLFFIPTLMLLLQLTIKRFLPMMMNQLLMKYFASPNFLILMKWSWTMLTKVANDHFKVYVKNAFDEWCKLQGYDTKNSYH